MILERKDIDPKYKWDLSVIYKNEEKFFEDYAKCEKLIKAYPVHEKTMLSSAKELIALMIAIGIGIPARKAMKIDPADALHDE